MDPLTLFVASIVGALISDALRTRRRVEEYYPASARGELGPHWGWVPMEGQRVRWWVEPGSAVWVESKYLRPLAGNIFDPDKLGAVARAVREANPTKPIEFYASYGQIHRIGPQDVAESLSYRDYDVGVPWTTGDDQIDDWLLSKERGEQIDPDVDQEMGGRLEEAVAGGQGDLGKWTATVRDGNHRTFGAVLGGERMVPVRLYDNDAQDVREAVTRLLEGREAAWNDERMIELLRKAVLDTGLRPDWLGEREAVRLQLPVRQGKLLPGPEPESGAGEILPPTAYRLPPVGSEGAHSWLDWPIVSAEEVLAHVDRTCPHTGPGCDSARDARRVLTPDVVRTYVWFGPGPIPVDHPMFRPVHPSVPKDVRRYTAMIRRGSVPPAVVLLVDNDGQREDRFFIEDGAHRLAAARAAGEPTIQAYIGERPWMAIGSVQLPDKEPRRFKKAEVDQVLKEAERDGIVERVVGVLLSIGVPAHMVFAAKFMIRYRWLFYPTIVDLLPEAWQRAINEAVSADSAHDPELLAAFLRKYGVTVKP